ncbi:PilZ domain-containing protein [Spiribacter halobius]|uniref:Cyclic diguanosine monophosphate-binding protein n=1 Tax=Sediminicurvatus halobius TaxID=2182432 RepID=A0A2U2MX65_9GAMM|nr:PilZ domain-containing protein [Spiribacter halobius]PWG61424.1 PilZ domain-containing protein [Spiribacter halobius]UEX76952.1 PilZ domain-containing protein [Spiribacter halobius]
MSGSEPDERRHFHRIHFGQPATLHAPGGDVDVTVEDISLHGARLGLAAGTPLRLEVGERAQLTLALTAGETIRMELELRHREGDSLGCACRHIDIDSISRLRRLVELNLGDPALLQRDLAELAG